MVIRVPPEKRHLRGGAVRRETHKAKMDAMFKDKYFECVFRLEARPGENLRTCFNIAVLRGWVIRDVDSGHILFIGDDTLRILRTEYGNITPPPRKSRAGRPLGRKNDATIQREIDNYLGSAKFKEGLFDE